VLRVSCGEAAGTESGSSFIERVVSEHMWADGIHVNIRLEQERLCLLVLVGVRADGTKELIALSDGHRESAGSWADLLRDANRRGMRAPVLAMGDGALGFWSALREVFPTTREQRCWFHKIANVLAALPKSAHPGAKKALAEIWSAEDKDHARRAAKAFQAAYGAKLATRVFSDEELARLRGFPEITAEELVRFFTLSAANAEFVDPGRGRSAKGLATCYPLVSRPLLRRPRLRRRRSRSRVVSLVPGCGLVRGRAGFAHVQPRRTEQQRGRRLRPKATLS